jgi:hypothetical protein
MTTEQALSLAAQTLRTYSTASRYSDAAGQIDQIRENLQSGTQPFDAATRDRQYAAAIAASGQTADYDADGDPKAAAFTDDAVNRGAF